MEYWSTEKRKYSFLDFLSDNSTNLNNSTNRPITPSLHHSNTPIGAKPLILLRFLAIVFSMWAVAVGVILLASMPVRADIYRYVDSQGVICFTNVPTIPGYRIYMREGTLVPDDYQSSRYDIYIEEAARKYGVPFSLIKAVMKAESNFDPYAVSKSGACGLMQIMPETAKTLGVIDSFNPRENIFGGARYLKELLAQFKGNLRLALAAYNAGPGRVQALQGMPPIEETRSFVRMVMKYLKRY